MSDDGLDFARVTIPYPSHIPRARGIHAVGKFGTFWKLLCSQADYDLVQQAADHIGIYKSELIRWAAVHVAREVLRDVEPETTDEAGHVEAG